VVGCADSIYFGGGTPSVLTPNQIESVIAGLSSCFSISADAEVTLEVNPGTVSQNRMADYRSIGINRISIGLQSCVDRTLVFLGRIHTARQGRDTYHMARKAGFDNVGLDLIYALPGQSPQRWQAEMAQAVHMAPEHLSCYTLTIEPGTPLAGRIAAGEVTPLDEKTAGVLFSLTIDYLNRHGYRQYEISNFARIGSDERVDRRSRHNRKYWNFAPYLGFGPAAHSFLDNKRWWNHPSVDDYLADIHAGRRPVVDEEVLTREQRIIEAVYLGLRQTDGIDLEGFRSTFNEDFGARFEPRLSRLIDGEMIEKAPQRIRLTRRGMLFLEKVVERLLG
jgi:oxygen-independent coproporphyrinogen-3 oxidase